MQEDIAGIKEDGSEEVKIESGGESKASTGAGEYIQLYNPSCKIKLESGMSIKTEAVEEFYGEETPEEIGEDVRQISKKATLIKTRYLNQKK